MSSAVNHVVRMGKAVNFTYTIAYQEKSLTEERSVLIDKNIDLKNEDDLEKVRHIIEDLIIKEIPEKFLNVKFNNDAENNISINFYITEVSDISVDFNLLKK
ncbi:hypothetical protein MOXK02_18880 [Moraxella sp. K02]